MISFFQGADHRIYAVESKNTLSSGDNQKLSWLFGQAQPIKETAIKGKFVGPRKEMVSPWSTNAVEITQTMGIEGITRIEEFFNIADEPNFRHDPMLQAVYTELNHALFLIDKTPDEILAVKDIAAYNQQESLALSDEEVAYLEEVAKKLGRSLTDSEVFGFSQVNSEHCRHKIFNGTFVIDGVEKPTSLFQLIKRTSKEQPNRLVSAYKDNVAFVQGPKAEQFAPASHDKADFFEKVDFNSVISLKAETHNFPTTVEPFYGASTGAGGEIRDRMAGGKASIPMAGTAVYMTSYPRLAQDRKWEKATAARPWLYQSPMDILIKASNGASDFGNKFGQPLISGSLLTFEHFENNEKYGFDKVIMLAGGIGYGREESAQKGKPEKGDKIVVMGGDNYRIGMGGSSVSSVATGQFGNAIELNAVQRANPEMQKRVANAIRAMAESKENLIVSIHDHGAGGHLNCLSELVEETGGEIDLRKLPVGDPTLSAKEIIGNESQERMGLVIKAKDFPTLQKIAERERAPIYEVGVITGDHAFRIVDKETGNNPVDWKLEHMFGNSPKTIITDSSRAANYKELNYTTEQFADYVNQVLQLEAVACKDWLTNKVDRCVTGRVAKQQTTGEIQLPLNNVAVMAIDFKGEKGIATSIGHAPVAAMIDPAAGSRLAIAEALTNVIWAPVQDGLKGISLSANWMWPCKNEGEDARLFEAVQAVSDFAVDLGINIPTGKDSLSMTQKYPDGDKVVSPGTVIISSVGEVIDIKKTVSPDLKDVEGSELIYIDLSKNAHQLGGSSFAQILNGLGKTSPDVKDAAYLAKAFDVVQSLISESRILAGHDISAGGLITALLEMCFPTTSLGLDIDTTSIQTEDVVALYFSENPGLLLQIKDAKVKADLQNAGIDFHAIGKLSRTGKLNLQHKAFSQQFEVSACRDTWFKSSYLLDQQQSGQKHAELRFDNYKNQPLHYQFPSHWKGTWESLGLDPNRKSASGLKAAIIREKGVNSDREMAYMMYMAGFDVKDIHMTDLISGREDLCDVNFIVFTGGFSNSDVLGSAKGWAGAFLYNEKAKKALDNFYARPDTLSMGVCNGCQLMVALDLVYPEHEQKVEMLHNESGKFECAFVNVDVPENNSVMLKTLAGSRLGIWMAHGEGKFNMPYDESKYKIAAKYSYAAYPANPNGSDFNTAAIVSEDGRHLAIMPHLERSIFPWNWANYPAAQAADELSPWVEALVNARKWVEKMTR